MRNRSLVIHRGMQQNPKNFLTLSANRIIAGEIGAAPAKKPRAFVLVIRKCCSSTVGPPILPHVILIAPAGSTRTGLGGTMVQNTVTLIRAP